MRARHGIDFRHSSNSVCIGPRFAYDSIAYTAQNSLLAAFMNIAASYSSLSGVGSILYLEYSCV